MTLNKSLYYNWINLKINKQISNKEILQEINKILLEAIDVLEQTEEEKPVIAAYEAFEKKLKEIEEENENL